MDDAQRRQVLMELVRELRGRYGSDREIARVSGINYTRISRWASGEGQGGITLANLVRLAEVSNQTVGDLLMALYGVAPEQLVPTAPTATVGAVVTGPDAAGVMRRLPGRYRMVLLLREDDTTPPTGGHGGGRRGRD